jgi:hypothetical protein
LTGLAIRAAPARFRVLASHEPSGPDLLPISCRQPGANIVIAFDTGRLTTPVGIAIVGIIHAGDQRRLFEFEPAGAIRLTSRAVMLIFCGG